MNTDVERNEVIRVEGAVHEMDAERPDISEVAINDDEDKELADAYDAIMKREGADDDEEDEKEDSAEEEAEAEADSDEEDAEQDTEEESEEEADDSEESEEASLEGEEGAGEDEEVSSTPPPEASNPAPESLPAAFREDWDKLGPNAQRAIAAHNQNMREKFSQQGNALHAAKPMIDAVEIAKQSYAPLRNMSNEQIASGMTTLLQTQMALESNPLDTIMFLAENAGVTAQLRSQLTGQPLTPEEQQAAATARENARLRTENARTPQDIDKLVDDRLNEREMQREEEAAIAAVKEFSAANADDLLLIGGEDALSPYLQISLQRLPNAPFEELLEDALNRAFRSEGMTRTAKAAEQKPAPAEPRKPAAAQKPAAKKSEKRRTTKAIKAAGINAVKGSKRGSSEELTEDEKLSRAYDEAAAR